MNCGMRLGARSLAEISIWAREKKNELFKFTKNIVNLHERFSVEKTKACFAFMMDRLPLLDHNFSAVFENLY